MKTDDFFIRSLVKAVRDRQSEQMKTSVLDGSSYQIQKFSISHFSYESKNLAQVTYFNINTGLTFPKLGRNLQRKCVSVQFSQKFLKGRRLIVKNFCISNVCQNVGSSKIFDITYENG